MREHLVRSVMVGHDLRDYVLLGYGGGGPVDLLGYAGDYPWEGRGDRAARRRGIGLAIAQAFLQAGASVCITARKQDELDAALRRPPDGQGNVRVQRDGSSV